MGEEAAAVPAASAGRVAAALAASRAPSTRRAYRAQWAAFERWAAARRAGPLPAAPRLVAAYLADRAAAGAAPSTLAVARAAIGAAHRAAGRPDPTAHEGVRMALAGLRRQAAEAGRARRQAAPLTARELAAIERTALGPRADRRGCPEHPASARSRGLLDIAIVRTMRDALLRRSEAAALAWGDLAPAADGSGRLLVRRSKTDPEGAGAVQYLSPATMDALGLVRPAGARPGDAVFGLSAGQIGRRVAAAARHAGLAGGFSGHSPRVGMAQDLAAAGCELPELMTAGRWSSPAMPALYTRSQAASRGAVAKYYGAAGRGAARRVDPGPADRR